jgi:hypothetical protein
MMLNFIKNKDENKSASKNTNIVAGNDCKA